MPGGLLWSLTHHSETPQNIRRHFGLCFTLLLLNLLQNVRENLNQPTKMQDLKKKKQVQQVHLHSVTRGCLSRRTESLVVFHHCHYLPHARLGKGMSRPLPWSRAWHSLLSATIHWVLLFWFSWKSLQHHFWDSAHQSPNPNIKIPTMFIRAHKNF